MDLEEELGMEHETIQSAFEKVKRSRQSVPCRTGARPLPLKALDRATLGLTPK